MKKMNDTSSVLNDIKNDQILQCYFTWDLNTTYCSHPLWMDVHIFAKGNILTIGIRIKVW